MPVTTAAFRVRAIPPDVLDRVRAQGRDGAEQEAETRAGPRLPGADGRPFA